jgi:hypothetical protein
LSRSDLQLLWLSLSNLQELEFIYSMSLSNLQVLELINELAYSASAGTHL